MKLLIFLSFLFSLGTLFLSVWALVHTHTQQYALTTPFKPIVKQPVSGLATEVGNSTIAFVSNRNGNYDIYQMDLTTKKTRVLVSKPGDDMNPQVSPDGKLMVFYSNRDGNDDIYRLDLKTHETTQLTNNNGKNYDPEYTPDGSQIVFKSTRDDILGDIFIMDLDGNNQKNLTRSQDTTEEWDPTVTKDGQIIFVVRRDQNHLTDNLYRMNMDGTNMIQITNNAVADWYPSINPQTGELLFISKDLQEIKEDLFVSNINGEDRRQLTNTSGNEADPAWDFNGKNIVFINDVDGDYDLYLMKADGTTVEKLEDTDSDELSPIFLPN